jgi:predicted phage-related endonuclease
MDHATISASRVAAMIGCDPHLSRLGLYMQLRGEMPPIEDNEILEEGREFEEAIARIAARKYSLAIDPASNQRQLVHGPLSCHLDRLCLQHGRVGPLEVKHAVRSRSQWGEPGTDQVPLAYWVQVQVQVHLWRKCRRQDEYPGLESAADGLLAANLLPGTTLYRIPLDAEVIAGIEQQAEEFLARLREGNPPDPRDEADMRMRWLVQRGKTVEATEEQLAWARQLAEVSARRRQVVEECEAEESRLKTLLLGFAKDAEQIVMRTPAGKVVTIVRLGADRRFDAAAFEAAHPEIAARFRKLDTTALGKQDRGLYESFLRPPESPADQRRTIRVADLSAFAAEEVRS